MHCSIYAIDDEKDILDVYQSVLEDNLFKATLFNNSVDAFHDLTHSKHLPDVILCDIKMPNIDGIELIQKLGQKGIFRPIIVVTGHASKDVAVRALNLGAYALIEKPFDIDPFVSVIRSAAHHFKTMEINNELIKMQMNMVELIKTLKDSQEQRLMLAENKLYESGKPQSENTEGAKKYLKTLQAERHLSKEIEIMEKKISLFQSELELISPWKAA